MRRISPTGFRVARRGTSREINRQIALNLVRSRQPISRADLARLMGVRRGAISRLVKDLLRAKQVFEGPKGESKRGRKPQHLYIETRRRCAMAVDISSSRTLILVTDPLGHPLLEIQEFPTRRPAQGLVKDLARNIKRLLAEHPEFGECLGVGIVVAGLVDLDRGRLRNAPTLGWRDVDLQEPLREAIGLPVVVENDVKACVLAQVWAVRGYAPVDGPVVFVNASDGVGVGIALDGQLLRGAHNNAGEFGHIALSMDGPLCACGQKGCWEAYVSVRATVARYTGGRPLVARVRRAERRHGGDDHRPRARGRGPGARDPARDRLLPGPRLRDDREGARAAADLRERRDQRGLGADRGGRRGRPCASTRSSGKPVKPRCSWFRSASIRACAARRRW